MGIDVVMENEDGDREEQLLDPQYNLTTALSVPGLESTVCLRFIDPYGYTVFNQLQIPQLIDELKTLRGRLTDDTVRLSAVQRLEEARRAGWAEAIIRDYESAVERAEAQPLIDHLDAVLVLARKAEGDVHTYLRFVGD
jgi:hypothetical protein